MGFLSKDRQGESWWTSLFLPINRSCPHCNYWTRPEGTRANSVSGRCDACGQVDDAALQDRERASREGHAFATKLWVMVGVVAMVFLMGVMSSTRGCVFVRNLVRSFRCE